MLLGVSAEELHELVQAACWEDPEFLETVCYEKRAHINWNPRADVPDEGDQQTSIWESQTDGVCIILGGNGSGTTETAVAKACKFLLDTPAPRPDTPFWFLANSLEMAMGVLWKEKIWGHGHIPVEIIDRDRISWHKSKQNWPSRVPLKADENGNNWELVFRSYEQGRASLQAESIGGFLFSEQFPWALLEEVVRGCREAGHSMPGSQYVEFTPVDPSLSIEVEEMLENGHAPETGADPNRYYLPDGWEIFTLNTKCAMEAGHVSREWFEQFFAMVSREMVETRMKGLFPDFKGLIYAIRPQTFVDSDYASEFLAKHTVKVYRTIDWGAGHENEFVVLFVAQNAFGQFLVFKEYVSTEPIPTFRHLANAADLMHWPKKNQLYGPTYADPSGIDGIRSAAELSMIMPGYDNWGIIPAYNSVLHGIDTVKWYLEPQLPQINLADGTMQMMPRLLISRDCPRLIRQMRGYRWEIGASEMGRNPRNAKPQPLKKDDHCPDALRYLLASIAKEIGLGPVFANLPTNLGLSDRSIPMDRAAQSGIRREDDDNTDRRFGINLDRH